MSQDQDSSSMLLEAIYSTIGGASPPDKGKMLFLLSRWFEDFHQLKNSLIEVHDAVIGNDTKKGLAERVTDLENDKTVRVKVMAALLTFSAGMGALVSKAVDWLSIKWGGA